MEKIKQFNDVKKKMRELAENHSLVYNLIDRSNREKGLIRLKLNCDVLEVKETINLITELRRINAVINYNKNEAERLIMEIKKTGEEQENLLNELIDTLFFRSSID
jgi:hypothetical protein